MPSEKEVEQLLVGLCLDPVAYVFACLDYGVEAAVQHIFINSKFLVYRVFQLAAGLVVPAAPEQGRRFEYKVGFAKQYSFHLPISFDLSEFSKVIL